MFGPEDEQRNNNRLTIDLPIQARIGSGEHLDLEIVDISSSGMQLRSQDFEVLKGGSIPNTTRLLSRFESRPGLRGRGLKMMAASSQGGNSTGTKASNVSAEPRVSPTRTVDYSLSGSAR